MRRHWVGERTNREIGRKSVCSLRPPISYQLQNPVCSTHRNASCDRQRPSQIPTPTDCKPPIALAIRCRRCGEKSTVISSTSSTSPTASAKLHLPPPPSRPWNSVSHTAKNTRSPVQLPCGAPAACRVLLVLRRRPHHPRAWLLRLRPLPRPRPVCGCTAAAPALICEPAAGLPPSARSRQLVPAGGKPPPRINSPVAAPVAPNLPDDHNLTRFVFGKIGRAHV